MKATHRCIKVPAAYGFSASVGFTAGKGIITSYRLLPAASPLTPDPASRTIGRLLLRAL